MAYTFAFLSPWLLLALPIGAGLLFYAYLRRGRAKKRIVGSLLLLRSFQRVPRARRTFVPPLRFFLELLALILLSLAGAGLFRREEVRRTALLLDTSRSMGTRAARPETRYQLALRQVEELSSASDQFMLFESSPQLQQRSAWLRKEQLAEALQQEPPLEGADNLELALGRLLADERFARVLVVSDQLVRKREPSQRLVVLSEHVPAQNVAIEEVSVLNASQAQAPRVRVKLAGFLSTATASVGVTLTPAVIDAGRVRLIPEAALSRQVALSARERKELLLDLPTLPQDQRIEGLQVSISPTFSPPQSDALLTDNEMYLELSGGGEKVLLVSDLSVQQLGLNALPHIAFTQIPPAAYAAQSLSDYRAAIFHRFVPPELPPVASLFVYPVALMPGAAAIDLVRSAPYPSAVVSKWHDTHRLLSYVQPSKFAFKQLLALSTPAWAEALIESDHGALLWAGERNQLRYAASGFELFPYAGRAASTLSVVFLNALSWLHDGALQGQARGYAQGWPRGSAEQLRDAQGATISATLASQAGIEAERFYPPPGLYIETVAKGASAEEGSHLRAVSFSSLVESNTLEAPSFEIAVASAAQLESAATFSYVKLLSLIVLLFLGIDLLLVVVRLLRVGSAAPTKAGGAHAAGL